ncbi:MAG TPA: class I SAM-dependent methyltransferase, partial [Vicinamibacterales bacterium]|nr:class I SAM-dependent methyltransferase [Vicinamibacterales bacterium]
MSEPAVRRWLRTLRNAGRGLALLPHLPRLHVQSEYLDREVSRLNAAQRRTAWHQQRRDSAATQTKASFDYQWTRIPAGAAMPSDAAFMAGLEEHICTITRLPRSWFPGKRVVDVGCGIGRFSYGLLKLGASVRACDQSEAALQRTAELCAPFADRLTLERIDLLDWSDAADFDLAFSFGVVHHTGNTYLALDNVCRKVAAGGRLFVMIYGVPSTRPEFIEVNEYDRVAAAVRDLSFDERRAWLAQRYGPDAAHGWFDAVSPRINDRL